MTSRQPLRVLYVFRERKRPLLIDWEAGRQPDTLLFGFNHLTGQGVQGSYYEPEYRAVGRAVARQVGRFGPDVLQIRALTQFAKQDIVFLTAGWPLLLLARRFMRRPPKLVWLNLSLETLLVAQQAGASAVARLRAALLAGALKQADRVVCVAHSQQESLARALGFAATKLPVVLSGVDAAFYTPADPPRADGYVLAAGKDAGRDYATFLAATAHLPQPARIVASRANLVGLNVPAGVTIEYSLPPVDLRERYRAAACAVVPTHGDGYPRGSDCSGTLVMLDAMACAKPVVITHRRSLDDYLSAGAPVTTVPAGDAPALRSAIERIVASPAESRRLDAAGRELIAQRFNTRAMAADLARVFFEASA